MFVIPAAGPGDVHLPVMSVLDGVVSEGPQDAKAKAHRAVVRRLFRKVSMKAPSSRAAKLAAACFGIVDA
jgi:hypothetical protein